MAPTPPGAAQLFYVLVFVLSLAAVCYSEATLGQMDYDFYGPDDDDDGRYAQGVPGGVAFAALTLAVLLVSFPAGAARRRALCLTLGRGSIILWRRIDEG